MKNIHYEIENLEIRLKNLKERAKESFESVLQKRDSGYYNDFKNTCDQILHLINGDKWSFLNGKFNLTHFKEWEKNVYHDICLIYDETRFGSPIGFICKENYLYKATEGKHRQMWIDSITNTWTNEIRSFVEFCENLEKDQNFLIKSFGQTLKEKNLGVFLQTYENKKLKIEKHYIYLENYEK